MSMNTMETEIQARCKRGRPGGKKGDNSDGDAEGECRQFVKGPSTAMEEVRFKFCVECARALMQSNAGALWNGDCRF